MLVAILSATETVNPKVPSTVEAAALCKMADRGQITGGILDGPLALDNAISREAAAIKHIVSPVAGRANVLVVPNLEAGNMLAKSLSFLAGAESAGIVLGARVPIILTSRADSLVTRIASSRGRLADGGGAPAQHPERHSVRWPGADGALGSPVIANVPPAALPPHAGHRLARAWVPGPSPGMTQESTVPTSGITPAGLAAIRRSSPGVTADADGG